MDYKLEVKPFKRQDGVKYKVIQLTDFALHTSDKQPTKYIGKKVKHAFDQNRPDRVYGPIINNGHTPSADWFLENLYKDPSFIKLLQKEEKKGYKVLISIPKDGLPIAIGKDTENFIKSKNGQRIIRKLAKNKNVD
ncbi:MAG: hypothetical protein WCV71_02820 [Patescibacteria group bacterium]